MLARNLLVAIVCACIALCAMPAYSDGFVSVKDGRFVDALERHTLLRGVNIGYGGRGRPWSHGGPEAFAQIRDWGMNCVRFVVLWSYIEPECGKIDEDFLRDLDEKIAWAKAHDIAVIIDFHQDLWGPLPDTGSGKFHGRGAPEWALVDKTPPHIHKGEVWSSAYMESPLIHRAFDNFWGNAPAPDGVGLQDHYAMAWQSVAKRYADEPAVVGYDIINEPFGGSAVLVTGFKVVAKIRARLEAEGETVQATDPIEIAREVLARTRDDFELFKQWTAEADEEMKVIDPQLLMPMYNRVAKAIREVDPNHIIFTAPNATTNSGIVSGITPVTREDGTRDPLYAYSPHAYSDSIHVVSFSLQRHADHAKSINAPLFLGEWGNLTNNDKIFKEDPVPPARAIVRILDEVLGSQAYWYYSKTILEPAPYFEKIVQRPYPRAVSGVIQRFHYDPDTARIECEWTESPDITAPSLFSIPAYCYLDGFTTELSPEGEVSTRTISENTPNLLLSVPSSGQATARRLIIQPK